MNEPTPAERAAEIAQLKQREVIYRECLDFIATDGNGGATAYCAARALGKADAVHCRKRGE